MSKTTEEKQTYTITELLSLNQTITELSAVSRERGERIYKLPFRMDYALARTLARLKTALEPINQKQEETQTQIKKIDKQEASSRDSKKDNHNPETFQKLRQKLQDDFNEALKSEVEFEPYHFKKWDDKEREQIENAGISAALMFALEPLGFMDSMGD